MKDENERIGFGQHFEGNILSRSNSKYWGKSEFFPRSIFNVRHDIVKRANVRRISDYLQVFIRRESVAADLGYREQNGGRSARCCFLLHTVFFSCAWTNSWRCNKRLHLLVPSGLNFVLLILMRPSLLVVAQLRPWTTKKRLAKILLRISLLSGV